MNKNFTKDDIIKKHITNLKSAAGGFPLAGVLGIIYVIRYFVTGNFDFHFSLSIPEMMLKLSHWGDISKPVAYAVTAVFFVIFLTLTALNTKNPKWFKASLAFYLVDFAALLAFIFVIHPKPVDPSIFIEVIIHFFIILFLVVAIRSDKQLREMGVDFSEYL